MCLGGGDGDWEKAFPACEVEENMKGGGEGEAVPGDVMMTDDLEGLRLRMGAVVPVRYWGPDGPTGEFRIEDRKGA